MFSSPHARRGRRRGGEGAQDGTQDLKARINTRVGSLPALMKLKVGVAGTLASLAWMPASRPE
jgi:hypothetical protein